METSSDQAGNRATSEFRIENLRLDAAGLSAEEFEDRYGSAFLLLSSTGFKQPKGTASTEVLLLDLGEDVGECTAGVSVRVVPVRASEMLSRISSRSGAARIAT